MRDEKKTKANNPLKGEAKNSTKDEAAEDLIHPSSLIPHPLKSVTIYCDGSSLGNGQAETRAAAVALLKQLSDIRIAFFDEPTVNMDAERRENLARQIGQVRHFSQLFVISHDDTFEEAVDHVLVLTGEADGMNEGMRAEG